MSRSPNGSRSAARAALEFRAEMFNLLNRTNFGNPAVEHLELERRGHHHGRRTAERAAEPALIWVGSALQCQSGSCCAPLASCPSSGRDGSHAARARPRQARGADLRRFESQPLHRRPPGAEEVRVWRHVLHHRRIHLPHRQGGLPDLGADRRTARGRVRDRQPHPGPQGRCQRPTCQSRAQVEAINARCTAARHPGADVVRLSRQHDRRGDSDPRGAWLPVRPPGRRPGIPYKEGNGFAYEPGRDHPCSCRRPGTRRPVWTLDNLKRATSQATNGEDRDHAVSRRARHRAPVGATPLRIGSRST